MLPNHRFQTLWRAVAFGAASALAVSLPLALGRLLWPGGLSGGAEFIFWLASGVNVAGLLLLGWRFWPVVYVGVFPAWFFFGQSPAQCFLGATGNGVEALLAIWILRRLGQYRGGFGQTRTVLSLLFAATVAPMLGALTVPALLVHEGRFAKPEFWLGLGNWALANGTAILVLTPLLVALRRGEWPSCRHPREAGLWVVCGVLCGWVAFDAVFQARGVNFAFLMFPFVIFAAIRFGQAEASAALAIVMGSLYIALARHAGQLAPESAPGILWFVQAFLWVLSATGLLVAALAAERRDAQTHALEASLREERARLDALRYQINPHFLFNTLNSLRATLPLEAETSRGMITELAGYLRTTLEAPDTDLAPLREEAAAMSHYLAIEQKRFGEALHVELALAPEALARPVPVFFLQPLVENAIRHGLEASQGRFHLRVEAALDARGHLALQVANTGTWREGATPGHTGLGLANIRRRLELLYGKTATVEIVCTNGWVRICLTLPPPA